MLTSLLATRMRTEDKLPAAEKLDRLGFWSLEMSCPADVLVGYFSKTA
jgi:pyruvate/oxaloacetate carboxyltransferase